ncbi:hypothetical protein PHYBLDRAFT_69785 [Phycomyces blakesleeanus NRRL 1555(-)]|uniref:Uncharacterized protein n=1 Tax=Phycomyces blakesleeanus (strain ATCC 8743b / DSM 1359 / FGSC 10004 / NBRC 33097 / NRRL 1555) TaxID=763407 RepID=A0A167PNW7_PHYB8|nr:hypothetical protein PHYBLDRAFT_69785 [Phycomyces blakesleeanus NRRL 1555(-)]OAD78276.1 hypothetical protein PHYBLDRAFT_69785 [Phycomyces blakesleeanus NRRL 1555(-)]|eukprot:XP_018296316.1 hypothetical protein PHYBLDRAFT_69785 [Phycomyces blakesleeanus NRRL 1555(-)]
MAWFFVSIFVREKMDEKIVIHSHTKKFYASVFPQFLELFSLSQDVYTRYPYVIKVRVTYRFFRTRSDQNQLWSMLMIVTRAVRKIFQNRYQKLFHIRGNSYNSKERLSDLLPRCPWRAEYLNE